MAEFDPQVTGVDNIWLEGSKSPGTARVRGAQDKRKFDIQVGPYMAGGITIYRGREVSRFMVDIYLLTADDWAAWHPWRRKWLSKPPYGKIPKAMRIAHPWLAELEIKDVQVEIVHQPEEDTETGGYVVTIEFIEFRTPKIALAKPVASGPDEDTDPFSKKIDARTKTIEAQLAELGRRAALP
jgi:hypothetical protein